MIVDRIKCVPNELCDLILEKLNKKLDLKKNNNIVGISGINCSGKSSLAKCLKDKMAINYNSIVVFDIDDFLFDKRTRNSNDDQIIGCYESFDYNKLFQEILIPYREKGMLKKIIHAINHLSNESEIRYINLDQNSLVIVEGIFLYRKDLPDIFDFKIWLNININMTITRALNRKREIDKHLDINSIIQRYQSRFIPAQNFHIERDKPLDKADLIVDII